MASRGAAFRRALGHAAALGFLISAAAPATAEALRERSDRIVAYRIEAALDHPGRTVRGRATATWRNTTRETVGEIHLHLYLNAFENSRTTFMSESSGPGRDFLLTEGGSGRIDIESLSLADGRDLLGGAEYVRPDDDNPDDETVLRVPLPEPVPPGGEVTFETAFASRLPRVVDRAGWKGDFYLVAQWFPKIGVYEEAGARGRTEGGWNCHQYHADSEFFADFGTFDVTITVPSGFVVGATGESADPPRANADGTTTYRFVQDDVHDFAWTADPDFVEVERIFSYAAERDPGEERRMARVLDLDGSSIPPAGSEDLSGVPEPLRLGDVKVRLLIQPEHRAQIDRHFRAVFNGLKYYGYWYGPYPYRTLTVVDPAYGASAAGGMEYPTFITAGSSWIAPRRRLSPESVILHEFGHQYWYGIVANNEFEEAWLDEGLTTYSTGLALNKAYGPDRRTTEIAGVEFVRFPLMEIPRDGRGGFFYLRWIGASDDTLLNAFRDLPFLTFPADVPFLEPWESRASYMEKGPTADEMLRRSWDYTDNPSYWVNSYDKPAILLQTLGTLIGEETLARALRVYQERHRFGHPTTEDFIAVVTEVAGRDLDGYFDQTIRGSGVLDYAVEEARNIGPEFEVIVRRLGDVRIPARIDLVFEGDRVETREWDGRQRWVRFRERTDRKIASARVGPPQGQALDVNWSNNARAADPDRWPALRWWTRLVAWVQNVLFFYSGIA